MRSREAEASTSRAVPGSIRTPQQPVMRPGNRQPMPKTRVSGSVPIRRCGSTSGQQPAIPAGHQSALECTGRNACATLSWGSSLRNFFTLRPSPEALHSTDIRHPALLPETKALSRGVGDSLKNYAKTASWLESLLSLSSLGSRGGRCCCRERSSSSVARVISNRDNDRSWQLEASS